MFTRVIVSSLALAAFANGLAFKRDDGYDTSTPPAVSIPTVTPEPVLLPDPSISLSLPPLDPSPTGTPTGTLPSLSLPPLDPTSTSLSSSLPSVVTTTVYVYLTQCSPTGTPPPTPSPSDVPGSIVSLPDGDDTLTLPPPGQPTPITLPDPQGAALKLPPVRRDDSVLSQLRALRQQVINTWVDLGKGNNMLPVVGQLESLIKQAGAPGANGAALLKQAQSLVNN